MVRSQPRGRFHDRFRYEDAEGEILYEYSQEGAGTATPVEGELVNLPIDYDERQLQQYVVLRSYSFYSGMQGNLTNKHINTIVPDA